VKKATIIRKGIFALVFSVVSSAGFAQDTIEQKDTLMPEVPLLVACEIVTPELPESFLTRQLNIFRQLRTGEFESFAEYVTDYEPDWDEYADSLFAARLSQIDTEIDLRYNPRVRSVIERYIVRRRNQTHTTLMLGRYYFPIFEQMLAEHGMPPELRFLAVIESSLNPQAVSRVGASGLWQFMYRTGRAFGLRVTDELDERFDPYKATEAAVLYLRQLHNRFGCWTLALAAYNSGQGTVNRAITRARGNRDFWAIYNFLPRETRSFVPIFIAATYAMTFHEEHGITLSETDWPEPMDTVMIRQRVHFDQIAKFTGIPVQTLRNHNPQYRRDIIPASENDPFVLRLPADFILRFIEYSDSIFANPFPPRLETDEQTDRLAESLQPATAPVTRVTYRVRRGDVLGLIALRFGVTVAQLKTWNNLPSDLIRVNQQLIIYTRRTNLRDMTEVVAFQNAQRARAAELAAAQQAATQQQAPAVAQAQQRPPPTQTPQRQPVPQAQQRPPPTQAPQRQPVPQATTNRPAQTQQVAQNRPATVPATTQNRPATAAVTPTPQRQPVPQATTNRPPPTNAQAAQNRPATASAAPVQQRPATTAPAAQNRPAAVIPAPQRQPVPQAVVNRPTNAQVAQNRPVQAQPPPRVNNHVTQRPQANNNVVRTAGTTQQASNVPVVQSRNVRAESGTIVHHRVQRGETLFSIHRRYPGSNIQEIIAMNNLRDNGNRIFPDQVLRIRIN